MSKKKAFYISLVVILMTIHKIHSTTMCSVFRNSRDNITPSKCLVPAKNVCQSLGAMVKDPRSCKCICPRDKGTYMENTQKCTAKYGVWSGCNFSLKGPPWSVPVFPLRRSTTEIIIPSTLKKCKISIDTARSFYLNVTGWKNIDPKKGFPFALSYERKSRTIRLKWTGKSKNHGNSIIRLGIKGCGKTDCLLFKVVSGLISYPCSLPTPIPSTPETTAATTVISTMTSSYPVTNDSVVQNLSSYTTMKKPSQRPTVVFDKDKHGSSSDGVSWIIIGPVIGVIIVLTVCVIVMVLCFWRIWKKKLKNNYHNSATSSSLFIQTPSSAREVAYTAPHHPYQDLKPPFTGFPPGVYQPLSHKTKEDASGYLLPVLPSAETSRDSDPEPIYNEIGSPRTLPTYDYALPENTVRLSVHSLNDANSNEPAYVGRPSKEQEGPNSNGAPKGVYAEPIQNGSLDEGEEAGYLELSGVDSRKPAVISTYQEPMPLRPQGHNQRGPLGEGQGAPSTIGPYQALEVPSNPGYEPLRLLPIQEGGNDTTA